MYSYSKHVNVQPNVVFSAFRVHSVVFIIKNMLYKKSTTLFVNMMT